MKILVVDHEKVIRTDLSHTLTAQGHTLDTAEDGLEALRLLKLEQYDVVFVDPDVPKVGGIELLRRIRAGTNPDTEVIMMSSSGSIRIAVQSIKLGARDFVDKPLRTENLLSLLDDIEQHCQHDHLHEVAAETLDIDREIVGRTEIMERVQRMIRIAARTDANVLIHGETGVGKDLIASTIHRKSHRQSGPYVKVECSLFPPSLIENELYGHEAGSFTGADQPRPGRFELAEQGTIYLDDVDDIPLEQQAKLLRAIDEKIFERVGGTKQIQGNVRVIASTKVDLLEKIYQGSFRQDLYYRLDVLRIRVQPLRDRLDDIPDLCEHLMQRIAKDQAYHIDPKAVKVLQQHHWPGNVRELHHALERAWLIGGGTISAQFLRADLDSSPQSDSAAVQFASAHGGGFRAAIDFAEWQLLVNALTTTKGNKTAAAASLGMKPSTFRDKLAKHGIK